MTKIAQEERKGPAFERQLNIWAHMDGSRELDLMPRLIAYSMLRGRDCAFLEGPDLLDDLLRVTAPSLVITINYDILVEDALIRSGRMPVYPAISDALPLTKTDVVRVFKLHGSINWLAAPRYGRSATLEVAIATTKPGKLVHLPLPRGTAGRRSIIAMQQPDTYVVPNRGSLFFELDRTTTVWSPVIAAYARGKPTLVNPEHLEAHRSRCLTDLSRVRNADVTVVGVHPASRLDDPVLSKLLKRLCALNGQKKYVGPDTGDCRYFRRRGFQVFADGLAAWLETIGKMNISRSSEGSGFRSARQGVPRSSSVTRRAKLVHPR